MSKEKPTRELSEIEEMQRDIRINKLNVNALTTMCEQINETHNALMEEREFLLKRVRTMEGELQQMRTSMALGLNKILNGGPTA